MAAAVTRAATSALMSTIIPSITMQSTAAAKTPMAMPTSAVAAPVETTGKPACGSNRGPRTKYDLGIHVVGLLLVLASSCFGAGFPVVAKKVKWLRIPPRIFFFCKHFGTGVLIATAFVHLLPTAFQSLNDPCLPDLFTTKYPAMPGVIGLASLFGLFSIEMWMHSKMPHAHSHGSATGEEFAGGSSAPRNNHPAGVRPNIVALRGPNVGNGDQAYTGSSRSDSDDDWFVKDEGVVSVKEINKDSDLGTSTQSEDEPAWFSRFRNDYENQRNKLARAITRVSPDAISINSGSEKDLEKQFSGFNSSDSPAETADNNLGLVELDPETVDPMVYKKMSLEITLLEGGILFHSVFVGMTVSITTEGFIVLLIAILFHQTFEGLGLGSRIAAVPYPKGSWKPWFLVFAFGTTAPIGQAIGLITHNTYDPNSAFALILVGTFNAISSGLLIYAALVDLLQQDFLSEEADRLLTNKKKTLAFAYVLMGAAGMSFVGAFA